MSASSDASNANANGVDCSNDLIQAFEDSFGECTRATGVSTTLGIVQPTSDALRDLLCTTAQCTDLYRLFRNNADADCTVGKLIHLNRDSVNQVLAVCATTAPTLVPNITEAPTPTPSMTMAPSANTSSSGGSNTGVIVGSVVGGIAALVLLCLLVLWCRRRTDTGRATTATKGDHYESMATTPRTEPTESGPWSDPAITAIRVPLEKIKFGPLLSQGAYGEVFRGSYNEQQVAIKKILPARRRILTHIHGFLEEIKLTASLEHDCIVPVIGVAWDSLSDLCMITEFMPGGDLRQLLSQYAKENRSNGFDYDKIKMAVQIAHALTYLHSLQPLVIHRDLKSRNILLTAEHDAKLIDFGVSRERRDLTMTAGVGTSLWMAPEVMLGERYNEKADVFSFGVVLSELDTHAVPYSHLKETNSTRRMADMIVMQLVSQDQARIQFTDGAHPEIVALALACVQVDPEARPSSAEVLHRVHTIWRASGVN